jgi:hypothetical protein
VINVEVSAGPSVSGAPVPYGTWGDFAAARGRFLDVLKAQTDERHGLPRRGIGERPRSWVGWSVPATAWEHRSQETTEAL